MAKTKRVGLFGAAVESCVLGEVEVAKIVAVTEKCGFCI